MDIKSSIFPAFTVMRFSYLQDSNGTPKQRRVLLGCFNDPEAAFDRAKTEAWQALCLLSRAPDDPPCAEGLELAVCGTEWGYDLCSNGRVVDRFWVHDRDSLRLGRQQLG